MLVYSTAPPWVPAHRRPQSPRWGLDGGGAPPPVPPASCRSRGDWRGTAPRAVGTAARAQHVPPPPPPTAPPSAPPGFWAPPTAEWPPPGVLPTLLRQPPRHMDGGAMPYCGGKSRPAPGVWQTSPYKTSSPPGTWIVDGGRPMADPGKAARGGGAAAASRALGSGGGIFEDDHESLLSMSLLGGSWDGGPRAEPLREPDPEPSAAGSAKEPAAPDATCRDEGRPWPYVYTEEAASQAVEALKRHFGEKAATLLPPSAYGAWPPQDSELVVFRL